MNDSQVASPETRAALECLARELEATMPNLLDEVRDLLAHEWQDFAQFLDEHHPEVDEAAVLFVHRLLDMAERRPACGREHRQTRLVFEQIGRQQFEDGGELSDLLSAYQVGARAAWRHVAESALRIGLGPHLLAALAEAVFAFVDEFSTASAHGYVLEQASSSAARAHRREELAELLLSGRSDKVGLDSAAERAGWPLPATAAVVLADPADTAASAAVEGLDMNTLPIRLPNLTGVIVPGLVTGERGRRLTAALDGHAVVIGKSLTLDLLPAGLHIARTALDLRRAGVLVDSPVHVGEHLDTVIANRDQRLLSLLRDDVLQPLQSIPPGTRDRLVETLRCWLWNMGDRQAMAHELHIHPQTVRYRLGRLQELFGGRLDEPHERARLFLVLAWSMPHARPKTPLAQRTNGHNGTDLYRR
ncbi:helix-turn-helix domain-containing protein [Nocardia terpenica]|nr:helix-turn-helix domain-containing protein [Nocardia terpenica]MBF6059965.1 helix-turn-helix domain-containing protein [Nocardia terpenica]MBF6102494.1 helix-turn-helix domain-containing protein [Nocardia terpenica]MBF6111315.1 helix-turn-helix domain-containing protein [Nocardia terpenica]MBF6117446.1 helix-turn-helix domain-containing protein [Nocardia terpenica]MBF6150713.1 helix-turn-helix domain-containing protein [Nocardia terpenica]